MAGHDQSDLPFAIAQKTLLWKPIFGAKWHSPSRFCVLNFTTDERIATWMRALTPPMIPPSPVKSDELYFSNP